MRALLTARVRCSGDANYAPSSSTAPFIVLVNDLGSGSLLPIPPPVTMG